MGWVDRSGGYVFETAARLAQRQRVSIVCEDRREVLVEQLDRFVNLSSKYTGTDLCELA